MTLFPGESPVSARGSAVIVGLLVVLAVGACKKDNGAVSVKVLLMNHWSVYSESAVVPSCLSSIRLFYTGQPADFYDFKSNDSLDISQAGNPFQSNSPFNGSRKYALLNDSSVLIYFPANAGGDTLRIVKISSDSLVLRGLATYSIANLCTNSISTYTVPDTLRLYR